MEIPPLTGPEGPETHRDDPPSPRNRSDTPLGARTHTASSLNGTTLLGISSNGDGFSGTTLSGSVVAEPVPVDTDLADLPWKIFASLDDHGLSQSFEHQIGGKFWLIHLG